MVRVLIGLVVRVFDRLLIYSKMQFILKWHFQFNRSYNTLKEESLMALKGEGDPKVTF